MLHYCCFHIDSCFGYISLPMNNMFKHSKLSTCFFTEKKSIPHYLGICSLNTLMLWHCAIVRVYWLLIFSWWDTGMFNAQGFCSLILSLYFLFTWEARGLLSCVLILPWDDGGEGHSSLLSSLLMKIKVIGETWKRVLRDVLKRTRPFAVEVILVFTDVFTPAAATLSEQTHVVWSQLRGFSN